MHLFMKEYNFVLHQRKNPAYLKLDSGIKTDSKEHKKLKTVSFI